MHPGMMNGGGGSLVGLDRVMESPLDQSQLHLPHQTHSKVSHAQSVTSSAASSTAGGGQVRFIRLIRRRNESYGFSLRGGLEHGTGFFISHVEPGSEAFLQGLRAGDQLLRVNNHCVERAIHREVTAMVQSKSSVILKVKSAGIIPVKEHRGDPLTWMVVDDDEEEEDHFSSHHVGALTYTPSLPSTSSLHEDDIHVGYNHHNNQNHNHHHNGNHHHHSTANQGSAQNQPTREAASDLHARVVIACGGKAGLGCSICKGPPEKPGIFVQSVRAGGVAKTAGLRPGDQILSCNDVSFAHLEFAEAVYVLKSSPRLVLNVLRGAGLDFVAGESSGYNSSASSVAGDQTPPSSSSSDPRDSDHSVTTRLSAVSHHLTLDRTRGWKEIEAEWADAEAAEKRHQLQMAQKNLKTRAQRDASHRLSASNSRSLCNLSAALREEDSEESTAFRDAGFSYSESNASSSRLSSIEGHYKSALRSTRSSSDVSDDTSHKIALVTSADPHVNNIVVTGGPKDEKDAVSRLEQLSSPSASRTSTLSSGTSQVTVRSSSGSLGSLVPSSGGANHDDAIVPSGKVNESVVERQLRELREEQKRLKEEAQRLAEERRKFEEERRRGLERTQSAPLAPLVINCSGQSLPPHLLQAPPSPTSSIASGRHTTRVLIKSPPPPPPPRKNTTTLSSRQSHSIHQVSPPASPAHSISSCSSGVVSLCGSGPPPRRCKSIGSLSASSSESTLWEDLPISKCHLASPPTPINTTTTTHCPLRASIIPPPPPPKPSAPLTSQGHISESHRVGGAPPPPPPPPPLMSSNSQQPGSLAAALSKELERRHAQDSVNGDENARGQQIQDKIDDFKKTKQKASANDPKRAQHDKLMEEFKLAHRKMFDSKPDATEDVKEEKPEVKVPSHTKVSRALPVSNLPVNSKIIDRVSQKMATEKTATKTGPICNGNVNLSTLSINDIQGNSSKKSGLVINDGATSVSNWKDMLSSVPTTTNSSKPPVASKKAQQENELPGGTSLKPSVLAKSPLRPVHAKAVAMEEFKPSEKVSSSTMPPNAYFEVRKENPSKPLVSISTYPSPNDRPTPVKLDFLPSTSADVEVIPAKKSSMPSMEQLQDELTSTLTRSNIRQRLNAQEVSPNPPSKTSLTISKEESSPSVTVNAAFTKTTIQNNSASPSASLSSKYRSIGQDASSTSNSEGCSGKKECERPDSLLPGILKSTAPASTRPLQKSISFGDVTTVGEDHWT